MINQPRVGIFRNVLGGFGRFRDFFVDGYLGMLRDVFGCLEVFWNVFWNVLWEVLSRFVNFEMFWDILGLFWDI